MHKLQDITSPVRRPALPFPRSISAAIFSASLCFSIGMVDLSSFVVYSCVSKGKKQARARNELHKERSHTHAQLRAACHELYAAVRSRRGVSVSCPEVTTRSETLKKQDWGKPAARSDGDAGAGHPRPPDGEMQRYGHNNMLQ